MLSIALAMLGLSASALGYTPFWCTEFTNEVATRSGNISIVSPQASPAEQKLLAVPLAHPEPGVLVFIDLQPATKTGQTSHVGIVESVEANGTVHTIEGNSGGPQGDVVQRMTRTPEEITGFGESQEAHEVYTDGLCLQLQEVKPWIEWDCAQY